jgi:hypothetical protein
MVRSVCNSLTLWSTTFLWPGYERSYTRADISQFAPSLADDWPCLPRSYYRPKAISTTTTSPRRMTLSLHRTTSQLGLLHKAKESRRHILRVVWGFTIQKYNNEQKEQNIKLKLNIPDIWFNFVTLFLFLAPSLSFCLGLWVLLLLMTNQTENVFSACLFFIFRLSDFDYNIK